MRGGREKRGAKMSGEGGEKERRKGDRNNRGEERGDVGSRQERRGGDERGEERRVEDERKQGEGRRGGDDDSGERKGGVIKGESKDPHIDHFTILNLDDTKKLTTPLESLILLCALAKRADGHKRTAKCHKVMSCDVTVEKCW